MENLLGMGRMTTSNLGKGVAYNNRLLHIGHIENNPYTMNTEE